MLLGGLIIRREALPGRGRQTVLQKTQSRIDRRVIVEGGNSKFKQK